MGRSTGIVVSWVASLFFSSPRVYHPHKKASRTRERSSCDPWRPWGSSLSAPHSSATAVFTYAGMCWSIATKPKSGETSGSTLFVSTRKLSGLKRAEGRAERPPRPQSTPRTRAAGKG